MTIDPRIYITVFILGVVLHLIAYPLISWRQGRYFTTVEWFAVPMMFGPMFVGLLDWLWS